MSLTQKEKDILYQAVCLHIAYIKKESPFEETKTVRGENGRPREIQIRPNLQDSQIQLLADMVKVRDKILNTKAKRDPKDQERECIAL